MIIALSAIISDLKSPDISFQGRKEEGEVLRSFFKTPQNEFQGGVPHV